MVVLVVILLFVGLAFLINYLPITGLIYPGSEDSKQTTLVTSTSVASPSPTPKNFRFDRTTDLRSELNKINPEVLESDFE